MKERYLISLGLTLMSAFMIALLMKSNHALWLMIAAYVAHPFYNQFGLRNSLLMMFGMTMVLIVVNVITWIFQNDAAYYVSIAMLFGIFLVVLYRQQSHLDGYNRSIWMMIAFFVIYSLEPNQRFYPTYETFYSLLLGSVISILISSLVLKTLKYTPFVKGVVSALVEMKSSLASLNHAIHDQNLVTYTNALSQLDHKIYGNDTDYPNWVFQIGYNRNFRAGFRYYLLKIEDILDVFHVVHYYLKGYLSAPFCQAAICRVIESNQILLNHIIHHFEPGVVELTLNEEDFKSDMNLLEHEMKSLLPAHLELLDESEYFPLLMMTKSLKEMRIKLLSIYFELIQHESKRLES